MFNLFKNLYFLELIFFQEIIPSNGPNTKRTRVTKISLQSWAPVSRFSLHDNECDSFPLYSPRSSLVCILISPFLHNVYHHTCHSLSLAPFLFRAAWNSTTIDLLIPAYEYLGNSQFFAITNNGAVKLLYDCISRINSYMENCWVKANTHL